MRAAVFRLFPDASMLPGAQGTTPPHAEDLPEETYLFDIDDMDGLDDLPAVARQVRMQPHTPAPAVAVGELV